MTLQSFYHDFLQYRIIKKISFVFTLKQCLSYIFVYAYLFFSFLLLYYDLTVSAEFLYYYFFNQREAFLTTGAAIYYHKQYRKVLSKAGILLTVRTRRCKQCATTEDETGSEKYIHGWSSLVEVNSNKAKNVQNGDQTWMT